MTGTKGKYTRRAALGLMGAGAAFAVSETAGFTQLTADRTANVDVADDTSAYLGITESSTGTSRALVSNKTYAASKVVELTNNFGTAIDTSAAQNSASTNGYRNLGSFAYSSVSTGTSKTGTVQLSAGNFADGVLGFTGDGSSSGLHADVYRDFLLGTVDTGDRLNAWFDGNDKGTIDTSSDPIWTSQERTNSTQRFDFDTGGGSPGTSTLNGRSTIDLTSSDGDYLVSSGTTSLDSAVTGGRDYDAAIFLVVDPNDSGDSGRILSIEGGSGSKYIRYQYRGSSGGYLTFKLGTNSETSVSTSTGTSPFGVSIAFTGSSKATTTLTTFYNGGKNTASKTANNSGALPSGATVYVGADSVGGTSFDGSVAEVLIYHRNPNSAGLTHSISDIQDYLIEKWAL